MNAIICLFLSWLTVLPCQGFLLDGAGPYCYHCSDISIPSNCHSIQECSADQECFTDRRVTTSLGETYTLGCRSAMSCSGELVGRKRNVKATYHNVTRRASTPCSQCCNENHCNIDVCLGPTHTDTLPSSKDVYVRLIGGVNAYEGTVEVFYNGEWGSICDDSWSGHDAQVVCKMLGYTTVGASALQGGYYPSLDSSRRIWLDEVQCTGTESSLTRCHKSPWGSNDCTHREDAAVLCAAVTPQDDIIYLLDTGLGGVLMRMNLLTMSYVPIPVNNVYHPITFDYDPEYGRIYFADGVLDQIVSIRFDGTDARELRQLDINTDIEKLEVDPLNQKLFYSDDGNNCIATMNLDGSGYERIVTSNLDKPREVVLDPRNRKVYWSDWGINPKIERANYDGSGRQTLASSGLQWPNGMAIDYHENRLYFVDGGTHKMEVMDLTGSNRRVILQDSSSHFFSLDFFGQYIYYTDWNRDTVMRVKKDGTGKTNVGPPGFRQLSDIRVHEYGTDLPGVTTESPVHFDRDHVFVRIHGPATTGFVEVYANGQWGTICDDEWDARDAQVVCRMVGLSPTGARAIGSAQVGHGQTMILLDRVGCTGSEEHIVDCGISRNSFGVHDCTHREDAGVLCTMDNSGDNFLLFASGGLLNRMSMESYSYTVVPIPNDEPNPIAMAFNPDNHRIYFTEVMSTHSEIYSADLDGKNPVLIKRLASHSVADGLDVDRVNSKIFYTDTGSDVIVSMNLDGTGQQTIISSGLDEPRAIVADPKNRVIYWTDWGSNPKIEKSNYDGSNRHVLVSTNLQLPNGLELDSARGILFFCDAGTHAIESVSTSGANRQVIFRDNGAHFFDLFLTDEYIYYTDWHREGVLRVNRDGSGQRPVGPPSFNRISGITGYQSSN